MLLALLQVLGFVSYPRPPGAVLVIAVAVALFCKRRSVLAVIAGDCHGSIFWHAAWHYTLPFGAFLAQLLLAHESTEELLKTGL